MFWTPISTAKTLLTIYIISAAEKVNWLCRVEEALQILFQKTDQTVNYLTHPLSSPLFSAAKRPLQLSVRMSVWPVWQWARWVLSLLGQLVLKANTLCSSYTLYSHRFFFWKLEWGIIMDFSLLFETKVTN